MDFKLVATEAVVLGVFLLLLYRDLSFAAVDSLEVSGDERVETGLFVLLGLTL